MKRLWLVVGLAILGGMVADAFADVQNIRLSGDIRIRGYYLNNVAFDNQDDDSFISQRTRVTIEADLEDHVLVVVTLKAEGLWGQHNDADESSGAGTGNALSGYGDDAINRRWEVGVTEAYVQLNEVFYSAATLKLGRQYLHYGRGLILSSVEQEYNFDAVRLVLDYYPLTFDVLYAIAVEGSSFGTWNNGAHDLSLVFANARYEMTDALVKDVELYFAWLRNGGGVTAPLRVKPGTPFFASVASQPVLIGARADINATENLNIWVEGAYEFGTDGSIADETISAWLANIGGQFALQDVEWTPLLNCGYVYASGGGRNGKNYFRPWFDYVDGYNGYLMHPLLSNVHVFNLGASVMPAENTTLAVQGYYYLKADKDGFAVSDPNVDLGITGINDFFNNSRELGWEVDTILGYDYSKDVRCQLVYAVFIPDNSVHKYTSFDAVAHEVRAELNVRF